MEGNTLLLVYWAVISLVAFGLMGMDKRRARLHRWRIPEKVLFLAALLGGSMGSIAGMYLFHHKTKHWYFRYGLPVILLAQAALVIWIKTGR